MGKPTSFRLPAELLASLDEEAVARQTTITALVTMLLDEGIKTRRFSGVVYRDGPAGRRASLIGGPDVWEVIRDVRQADGRGEERLRTVANATSLTWGQVRLAVEFYAAHPAEIDERIEADERESGRVRRLIEQREQLLSS